MGKRMTIDADGNSKFKLSPPDIQLLSSLENRSFSSSGDPVAKCIAASPARITITEPNSSVSSDCDLPLRSVLRETEDWRNNNSCLRARSYYTTSTISRVRFGTVAIREYERRIGVENRDIDLGLAIDWAYEEGEPISLDSIEPKESYQIAEAIDGMQRARILMASGYTDEELQAAIDARHEQQNARAIARAKKRVSIPNMFRKPVRMMKKRLSLQGFRKK